MDTRKKCFKKRRKGARDPLRLANTVVQRSDRTEIANVNSLALLAKCCLHTKKHTSNLQWKLSALGLQRGLAHTVFARASGRWQRVSDCCLCSERIQFHHIGIHSPFARTWRRHFSYFHRRAPVRKLRAAPSSSPETLDSPADGTIQKLTFVLPNVHCKTSSRFHGSPS